MLTNTLPLPPEKQLAEDRGALDRPAHRRGPRRRVRRHQRQRDLRRREPGLRSASPVPPVARSPAPVARLARSSSIAADSPSDATRSCHALHLLVADTGRPTGSAASRRLRAEDRIPGVLYGHGMDAARRSPSSAVTCAIALSGAAGAEHRARPHRRRHGVPGDRQGPAAPPGAPHRHPRRLPPGQPRRGDHGLACRCASRARPPRCSQDGGLVDPAVDSIEVVTTPRNIPDEFVVDVSDDGDGHRHPPRRHRRCPPASPPTGDPEMPGRHRADDARRGRRDRGRRRRARRGAGRGRPRATAPRLPPPRAATPPPSDPTSPADGARRVRRSTPFDWLVVGLGNPGKEYARTRHNVGEEVVGELARAPRRRRSRPAATTPSSPSRASATSACVLAFPLTYMNDSGQAVRSPRPPLRHRRPEQIVDRPRRARPPAGRVRVKAGGGLAGHNGLRSIAAAPQARRTSCASASASASRRRRSSGADHVLSQPAEARARAARRRRREAADAVELIVADGVDAAMRTYNGRRLTPDRPSLALDARRSRMLTRPNVGTLTPVRLADLPPLLRDEPALTRALGEPDARLAVVEVGPADRHRRPRQLSRPAAARRRLPDRHDGRPARRRPRASSSARRRGRRCFPAWETLPFERVSPSRRDDGPAPRAAVAAARPRARARR